MGRYEWHTHTIVDRALFLRQYVPFHYGKWVYGCEMHLLVQFQWYPNFERGSFIPVEFMLFTTSSVIWSLRTFRINIKGSFHVAEKTS